MDKSIYDYVLKDIHGNDLPLARLAGKKILFVNTASQCGYTPQYAQLQELHENFGHQVQVIGLPCDDFGGQEPGTEKEIADFCETNFNITFPLTEKVKIKGEYMHPLYQYLTQKELNHLSDSEVVWNFQKYLINENGHLQGVFAPAIEPLSEELLHALGVDGEIKK